jgi:hypothetical protein
MNLARLAALAQAFRLGYDPAFLHFSRQKKRPENR